MMNLRNERGEASEFLLVVVGIFALALLLAGGCAVGPIYRVWEQKLAGQAELNRATYNRQIAVQEANAKFESSKLLAEADVERAKGAAQANVILGNGLKGNEDYLKYLWIQNLEKGTNPNVIYVPTEAGLPILESTRHLVNQGGH